MKSKQRRQKNSKFSGRIHSILSDTEKRKIYDQSGQYDEESEEVMMRNWADYWKTLFKKITVEDINNYEKNYKGSEIEIKDLKRAYTDSKTLEFSAIFIFIIQLFRNSYGNSNIVRRQRRYGLHFGKCPIHELRR